MDILDDMGVTKLSAKDFFLKWTTPLKDLNFDTILFINNNDSPVSNRPLISSYNHSDHWNLCWHCHWARHV